MIRALHHKNRSLRLPRRKMLVGRGLVSRRLLGKESDMIPHSPAPDRGNFAPLLEMLKSVIEGRSAVYLSTPITTGKKYLEWALRYGAVPQATDEAAWAEFSRQVI